MNQVRIVLTTLLILTAAAVASPVNAENLQTLESLRFDEVCGLGELGHTLCLNTKLESEWLPQTVTSFIRPGLSSAIHITENTKCGIDTEGVKCFGSMQKDFDLKGLIEESLPSTVQTSQQSACGLSKKRTRLHCLTMWPSATKTGFTVTTAQAVLAVGVANSMICWAEKKTITCRRDGLGWNPSPINFLAAREILVGTDWLCARNQKSAQCWFPKNQPVVLAAEFLTATKWRANRVDLCALSKDHRIVCVDFQTGQVAPPKDFRIPPEYTQPNGNANDLWMNDNDELCALKKKEKTVECWYKYWGTPAPVPYSFGVLELHGSIDVPCALLDNGSVECRGRSTHNSRSVKQGDRLRVEFGGYNRCYWNNRGIDCPGRMDRVDFLSVKAASSSSDGESLCVFGTELATSRDAMTCYGWNSDIRNTPADLVNVSQISVEYDNACALSDDGLGGRRMTCWGSGYRGDPVPSRLSSPTKVLVGSRHGCAIDRFGLICWGDLDALDLRIPEGLDAPGKVIDFALSSNRTCAVLESGEVQCWGRLYSDDQDPPPISSATAIVGSGASLFCALSQTTGASSQLHCWGGHTAFPQ